MPKMMDPLQYDMTFSTDSMRAALSAYLTRAESIGAKQADVRVAYDDETVADQIVVDLKSPTALDDATAWASETIARCASARMRSGEYRIEVGAFNESSEDELLCSLVVLVVLRGRDKWTTEAMTDAHAAASLRPPVAAGTPYPPLQADVVGDLPEGAAFAVDSDAVRRVVENWAATSEDGVLRISLFEPRSPDAYTSMEIDAKSLGEQHIVDLVRLALVPSRLVRAPVVVTILCGAMAPTGVRRLRLRPVVVRIGDDADASPSPAASGS